MVRVNVLENFLALSFTTSLLLNPRSFRVLFIISLLSDNPVCEETGFGTVFSLTCKGSARH